MKQKQSPVQYGSQQPNFAKICAISFADRRTEHTEESPKPLSRFFVSSTSGPWGGPSEA